MASNVVNIVVQSSDDTKAGFDQAKASADTAAEGMDTYAEATARADEAEARFRDAQAEAAAAQDKLGELQTSGTASADELAAAQDKVTAAVLRSVDAQLELAAADERVSVAERGAGDAAEVQGAKSEESGGLMASMGSKAKMALLGVAVGAGFAVKSAMEYQDQSTELVTGAGELEKNLKLVEQGMLSLSVSTDTSTSQLQSGMYMIESAGFHGAAGLKVLQAAAQGAQVGNADLGTVADAVTTVLKDYGLGAGHAAAATGGLIATVAAGKTHLQDLASSLSKVLPTAAALKVSFPEVAGAMATMTGEGVSARLAATHLNSTLLALANPSKTAAAAMSEVGLTSAQVAGKLTHGGLAAALEMVTDAAGKKFPVGSAGYVAAVDKMLGGQSGLAVALQLTGKHLGELKANTEAVGHATSSGSALAEAFAERQKDSAFQVGKAEKAVGAMGISLGMALLPAVTAIVKPLASMLQMIAGNHVAAIAFAAVVGGVLAGALGGKLAGAFKDLKSGVEGFGSGLQWLLGKLGLTTAATEAQTAATEEGTVAQEEASAAMSVSPIMLIVGAIALLAVGIYELVKHWHAVADAAKTAFKAVKDVVLDVVDWIRGHWELLVAILLGPIAIVALELKEHWKEISKDVSKLVGDVVSFFTGLAKDVGHWFETMWDDLYDREKRGIENIVKDVKKLYDDFSGWVYKLKIDVGHWFETMWNDLVTDAKKGPADVLKWIRKMGDDILTFFSGLATDVFNAGKHIIHMLASGISSAIGEVTHAVGGIVSKIKDFLPFSPAREGPLSGSGSPDVSGSRIPAMLAQGMLSGIPSVASAARHLAGAAGISPGGGVAGYGGAGAAGAGGPLTIQINPGGSGLDQLFMTWLKNNVRASGGDPRIFNKKVQFQ